MTPSRDVELEEVWIRQDNDFSNASVISIFRKVKNTEDYNKMQEAKLKMKILNLYAGIGGNRKLWGSEHEITAVENVPEIAKIYQDFFPNDKVIVGGS